MHRIMLHKKKNWQKVLSVSIIPICFCLYQSIVSTSIHYPTAQLEHINADLAEIDEGEVSLLTYNIAGLPDIISSAQTSRASSTKTISSKINRYDIVNVQEDFHYHRILYGEENRHRYKTKPKMAVPYGDGLNTLSKYPILKSTRIPWLHCNGADCLASKGFSYVQIELAKNVVVDVYNIHATARDEPPAAIARKQNMEQLANYISKHSVGKAVIVMGDFNAHYGAVWDNLDWFTKITGLEDVWTSLIHRGEQPEPSDSFVVKNKLSLTDSCESIDKILFRNSESVVFSPIGYKLEKQFFCDNKGFPLSDHYAVSCSLRWKRQP